MTVAGSWPFKGGRTVVFVGKRGVGKSSTLNRLFGFTQSTDPAVESTVAPHPQWITEDAARRFRIVDMPGIAADSESDRKYGKYYRHWLSRADTIVWITQANVRAYKQDQVFFRDYSKYVRSGTRLVLALSKADTQVDDLSAAELNPDVLRRKAADASSEIIPYSWAKPDDVTVVPYSVDREWNLERLRAAALDFQLMETS